MLVLTLLCLLPVQLMGADTRPIKFIANHGQWAPNVLYRANIPGGTFYLEKNEITYHFFDAGALHAYFHDHKPVAAIQNHVIRIRFAGSAGVNMIVPDQQCPEYYNYIIGKDPSKWASHLNAYGQLLLHDVWPGIDMEITGQNTSLKYSFIVHPGADPSKIKLQYAGASSIGLNTDTLKIGTTLVNMDEQPPVSYQMQTGQAKREDSSGGYRSISTHFRLNDSTVSFSVGRYDRHNDLTIDPILVFSTFSGSVIDNWGFTGTYNNEGNGLSGGIVFGDNFPMGETGGFQTKFQQGHYDDSNPEDVIYATDCAILKYSPDGSKLLWGTYLGGRDNEEPHSMVVNSKGELIIMGTTASDNFPTTAGNFSGLAGGSDIFIASLSTDGDRLIAGSLIGGTADDGLNEDITKDMTNPLSFNYGDKYRGEVIVDKNDNVLVASCTQSYNFPVSDSTVFQNTFSGKQDGCVIKLSPNLKNLLFSTFMGGSGFDAAYGINMDSKGNIFVAGGTNSEDFRTTSNASMRSFGGDRDGFLCKISPDGKQLLSSTFVGTNAYDQAYFVQVDNFDRVYVTGQTLGNFPASSGVYFNPHGKQFIAVYSNDLHQLIESTVYGAGRSTVDISPSAFLVDVCGRVYVSGWGGIVNSIDNTSAGTTYNMPITADAFQKKTDGSDFYLAIFGRDLKSLVYATFFGGPYTPEHVDGGTSRFDREGKVYQSVCGGCGGLSDFPTTPNAWSKTNNGKRTAQMSQGGNGGCNNAMFKIDLNSSDYPPQFKDTFITMYAGEMLDYNFNITTPDNDSIYVKAASALFAIKNAPNLGFRADSGISIVKAHFYWQTQCNNVSTDTYTVAITARNNSCPVPRVITHTIRIIVKEPPIPDPPAVFCLERLDSHTVRVNWDDFTVGRYFGDYKLVKKFPDGHISIVTVIKTDKSRSYTDVHDTGLYTKDYQYLLYGSNVCDALGDSTRWLHSVPDPDSIPKPVYIYTATVENDKNIRLNWAKYQRADFYYYYLYRKDNKPGAQYQLYTAIKDQKDTTFLDTDVDVHSRSYCYKIIVHNQCGLISPDGNIGCSIFLSGASQPFEHHLSWNAYEKWPAGVCQYQVHRWDPSKPDSLIGYASGNKTAFVDDSLNYDQGVYWYKVIANECVNGKNQRSVSNVIKLIQAPYLYIPNAFTPNNDGLNDRWKLVPVFVKDYHLKIFDGWGGFVWETFDKHATWDGMYKGNKPFNNVFIWQTEYTGWDNSRHYQKGNVSTLP